MSTSDLSPAGSSSYSSSTLHVGDGTWDSGRDDFLLPNLVGLNFATMQYNGMGNRFKNLPEYHQLITGHGVLAAITFLLILPIAIWSAKYWRTGGRKAVRLHVYCQILVLVLSTVVLVLGWFAVGPERSLTNPHHGIGVAIYTMIWVQFLFGWLMGRLEKRRKVMPNRVPTKVWIHKLFGRSIALLGIIQIALGLTLYGSPKALFIVYALWVAFLLFLYLALDRYYYEKRPLEYGYENAADFYSDYGSYVSGSRTEYTEQRPPSSRPRTEGQARDESHWGRNLLAGAGALGAYEAFKNRRVRKREEREQAEIDEEDRRYGRHQQIAPLGVSSRPQSRPGSRPPPGTSSVSVPPPGVQYGSAPVQSSVSSVPPPEDDSRLSPTSWEDEKYNERPERHSWRERILTVGGGIAAFEGVRRLFSRKDKRKDDYVDDHGVRPHGGHQNMVSQTDVSRVEHGQAPLSPDQTPGRMNVAGGRPMTPTQTPSRPPRRPRPRQSADSLYDDEESEMVPRPRPGTGIAGTEMTMDDEEDRIERNDGLRESIATFGAIAGFREWNRARKERRERQRQDQIRQQELNAEEGFHRRHSGYPNARSSQGASGFEGTGRRPSTSGTLMTGPSGNDHDVGFGGSNPELSRTNFSSRPDTHHPPLPSTAGDLPSSTGAGLGSSGAGPSSFDPTASQQRFHDATGNYNLPPPPPGPPPGGERPSNYRPPEPGSLQMPQGAVEPDPSRLFSQENVSSSHDHPIGDAAAAAAAGGLAGAAASEMRSGRRRRGSQSDSPSRYNNAPPASGSGVEAGPSSQPPVNVRVKMHRDGDHVTLQRLTQEEADAKRAARRADRRQRRRHSSASEGLESDAGMMSGSGSRPPGSNARFKKNGMGRRNSADQPITNVPPPPPLSASAAGGPGRRPSSELMLPPALPSGLLQPQPIPAATAGAPRPPPHASSPHEGARVSTSPPVIGSGLSGSPGDAGTGTDVSAFADNRRRRRAERARRLEAARGTGGGGRQVEFE
ncbi:hypothetical protein EJ03DRAFT_374091 [Teratosphaeria nubilosa]|uniref:Cytochrome b561 domain-containing protein n=1 Tax=Teratosphaeria nubilosa TaxID=161662 RepID=A0A6G1LD01_9PEZI|nr:hypothetical protein EJ03DRAFT_374091 [Teratosphaeria nubilosa]